MVQLVEILLVRVEVRLGCRGLHHGVDVVVVHFEVRLGHSLPLGARWYVACVCEHVCAPIALLVVASGENSLFVLLLALRDVALISSWLVAALDYFLLLLSLNLHEVVGMGIAGLVFRNFQVLFELLWIDRGDVDLALVVEDWCWSLDEFEVRIVDVSGVDLGGHLETYRPIDHV